MIPEPAIELAAALGRFVLAAPVMLVLLGSLVWQQYRTNRRQKLEGDDWLDRLHRQLGIPPPLDPSTCPTSFIRWMLRGPKGTYFHRRGCSCPPEVKVPTPWAAEMDLLESLAPLSDEWRTPASPVRWPARRRRAG